MQLYHRPITPQINRTTHQHRTPPYETTRGPYCKLVSPMVGNGLVPYDDLYHEYPERHEQTKYMAAAPNKECESVSFVSALSFGKMYADPLASVYPSQLKNDTPQSDIKKQTFVPVRLRLHWGSVCVRVGVGAGVGADVCLWVLVFRYVCIYKALPSAGGLRRPLRSLRKEKYIELREADRRSMIE